MASWQHRFDRELQRCWNITAEDSGLGPIELDTWQGRFPIAPEQAAFAFGEKYDLIPSEALRGW